MNITDTNKTNGFDRATLRFARVINKGFGGITVPKLALGAGAVAVAALAMSCKQTEDAIPTPEVPSIMEETTAMGALKSRAPLTAAEKTAILANINGAIDSADFAWYKENAGKLDIFVENGLAGSEPGFHLTLAEAQGEVAAIAASIISHFKANHIFETKTILTKTRLDFRIEKNLVIPEAVEDKVINGFDDFKSTPTYDKVINNNLILVVIVENLSETEPHFAPDGLHFPLSYLLDEANTPTHLRGRMVAYVNSLGLARAKPLQKTGAELKLAVVPTLVKKAATRVQSLAAKARGAFWGTQRCLAPNLPDAKASSARRAI